MNLKVKHITKINRKVKKCRIISFLLVLFFSWPWKITQKKKHLKTKSQTQFIVYYLRNLDYNSLTVYQSSPAYVNEERNKSYQENDNSNWQSDHQSTAAWLFCKLNVLSISVSIFYIQFIYLHFYGNVINSCLYLLYKCFFFETRDFIHTGINEDIATVWLPTTIANTRSIFLVTAVINKSKICVKFMACFDYYLIFYVYFMLMT